MENNKVKMAITAYVPGTMCNFRCKYCYISNCVDEHLEKPTYNYPLETMIKAFDPKRLKGIAEITVISGGETLIDDTIVPFIHGLLKFGHVVTVVTNLTLNNRIDELLDIPEQYLKRLIVKGSLHWEELKRLNKIDDYFNNMNKVLKKGASTYPFLVLSEDYMPYLDEINNICMERIGALPHCTPNIVFEDKTLSHDGKIHTNPECTQEFVDKINNTFNSEIFKTSVKFLNVDVEKVFCYAGLWSFVVSLKDGSLFKCHNCPTENNFYENLEEMPELEAIGNNCQITNCALQYNFLADGLIPEFEGIPTYGQMLARPRLINEEVRNLLDVKFNEIHKEYNKKKQEKTSLKVQKLYKKLKQPKKTISFKNKVRLTIYNNLKHTLEKKGLI